jgi:hypothetical protein
MSLSGLKINACVRGRALACFGPRSDSVQGRTVSTVSGCLLPESMSIDLSSFVFAQSDGKFLVGQCAEVFVTRVFLLRQRQRQNSTDRDPDRASCSVSGSMGLPAQCSTQAKFPIKGPSKPARISELHVQLPNHLGWPTVLLQGPRRVHHRTQSDQASGLIRFVSFLCPMRPGLALKLLFFQ